MCQRRFPVVIHGATCYVLCTLRAGHQCPCEGTVLDNAADRALATRHAEAWYIAPVLATDVRDDTA